MPTSSSSSSSPQPTAVLPTLSRLRIVDDGLLDQDEDAWALDSDDDDFAPQKMGYQQQQHYNHQHTGVNTTSSFRSPSSPYPPSPIVERSVSSSSISSTASTSGPRKHAPPARPHPYPLPSTTTTTTTAAASAMPFRSSSLSQTQTSYRGRDDSRDDHDKQRSSSSWTMIGELGTATAAQDRNPSIGSTSRDTGDTGLSSTSTSKNIGTGSLAGSPPAELGSTAAEAVLQACLRGQEKVAANDSSPPLVSPPFDTTSPSDMARSPSIVSIGLDKKKDREASNFSSSIRPEVMDIVKDPFAALPCLTKVTATSGPDSAFFVGSSAASITPTTAIQRQQEHARNLGMARGFNELNGAGTPTSHHGSPITASSPAPMPRSASASSTNWKAGSRGRGAFAPWSAKRQDSFDTLTMAGEGVTMSGRGWGRNSSTSSLDQSRGNNEAGGGEKGSSEADGERTPGGGQYLPLSSDAEGPIGLRREKSVRTKRRWREFVRCLEGGGVTTAGGKSTTVDLAKLRELSWNGIPSALRPIVWPLLLGYIPPNSSMRSITLARKRAEYRKAVQQAFGAEVFLEDETRVTTTKSTQPIIPLAAHRRNSEEEKIWHQISIDVPRTNPSLPLWQRTSTQRSLERLLYIWAIRHHATGYVQGMSDLATPFFQVFLSLYLHVSPEDEDETAAIEGELRKIEDLVEEYDPAALPLEVRIAVEADTYWCLGKLLDGIQENYIFAQPGITRQVRRMEELVGRIDAPLHAHLKSQQVEYIQFAFRWMNCLLMREISVQNVTRLWDTYLAEGPDAFSDFHLYVCSVFLCKWSKELRGMDFQGVIMFLQSLPTRTWSDHDAELLLSEAFVFKNLFGQTRHLGD